MATKTAKAGPSTSRARPGPSTAPTKTVVKRTTKPSTVKAVDSSVELAKDLERVLKVSRPVNNASAKPAITAKRTTKPTTSTSTGEKPPTKTGTAPLKFTTGIDKGKQKLGKDVRTTDEPAWASPNLKPSERARGASAAITENTALLWTTVVEAQKNLDRGFTPDKECIEQLNICELGLKVLLELETAGQLGIKASEIEKARQWYIARLLPLKEYARVWAQLEIGRPIVLRQLGHEVEKGSASGDVKDKRLKLVALPKNAQYVDLSEAWRLVAFQTVLHAWVAAVGEGLNLENLVENMPFPDPTPHPQHPFHIATSLSITSTRPNLVLLHRQLLDVNPNKIEIWLHAKFLAVYVLSLTASAGAETKVSPGQIWDHALKFSSRICEQAKNKQDVLVCLAGRLSKLVDWVETVAVARGESMKAWTGFPSWSRFMDLWMSVANKVGNITTIDRILALQTANLSLSAEPVPPQTPSSSGSNKSVRSRSVAEAETAIAAGTAALVKLDVLLRQYQESRSELDGAAVQSAFKSTDLPLLSDSLLSLPAGEKSTKSLERICRAVERARRGSMKLIPTASTTEAKEGSLQLAARTWLIAAVDLVEDILSGALDIASTGNDLGSGAIASLTYLCSKAGPSSPPSLVLLERAHRICDLVTPCSTSSDRANYLHCISSSANFTAAQYWRKEKVKEALSFAVASYTWAEEALSLFGPPGKEADEGVAKSAKSLRNGLLKVYELVGVCHLKLSNPKAAVDTFCQALASASRKAVLHIQQGAAKEPIRQVFTGVEEVSSIVTRLASLLGYAQDTVEEVGPPLFSKIRAAGLPVDYVGAIGEQLLSMWDGRGGPTAAEQAGDMMFAFAEAIMDLYVEKDHPIRRLRVILRLMSLIGQTGLHTERFNELAASADRISKLKVHGEDAGLLTFLPGLLSTSTLLRALHAYHSNPEPTLTVLALAKQAMSELRTLILPPTAPSPKKPAAKRPLGRAATVKVPPPLAITAKSRATSETKVTKSQVKAPLTDASPRKPRSSLKPMVIDDVSTFAQLLGSLCSLLGLLGLTLQKVGCLKLLRALLRGRPEVADDYIHRSAELGTEYLLLGKVSRASTVFTLAQRYAEEHSVTAHTQCELALRFSAFLASTGHLDEATQMYDGAAKKGEEIETPKRGSRLQLHLDKIQSLERGALARYAAAAMASARDDITGSVYHLSSAFRLRARVGEVACRVASARPNDPEIPEKDDDPFTASESAKAIPPDQQPAKDETVESHYTSQHFGFKVLCGLQWRAAEMLFRTSLDWTAALSTRGSAWDAQGILSTAAILATSVKSTMFSSRVATSQAELLYRRGMYDEAETKLAEAIEACPVLEGPDGVEIKRIRGDILTKIEMVSEARQLYGDASKEVHGLDSLFTAAEAMLPSPRKNRLSSSTGTKALVSSNREPLLPVALAHVLRREAWLLRESGQTKSSDELLAQLDALCSISSIQADKHHLDGQIGLLDAFSHFKADLWMSSLTESTIAMPMGSSKGRMRDRQSTRDSIQVILEKSQSAYLSALALSAGSGRVEEVRSACLSLALLRAFQTSLGQGSDSVTAAAAEILASTPAITLHRELLESIQHKLQPDLDDLKWPTVSSAEVSAPSRRIQTSSPIKNEETDAPLLTAKTIEDSDQLYRDYWSAVRDRYETEGHLKVDQAQVDILPPDWVVVSINVTDDKNTMFISRHQANHPPLVFSLPLDRQGRREGEAEEDLFTYETARGTMRRIINESNEGARNAKNVHGAEGRAEWWEKRYDLNKQLKELVTNLEFCWLGAFKTILAPRPNLPPTALEAFRDKLDRIFHSAISGPARTSGARPKVQLDTALLECFAALSSKCKDEEAEDLVYFILDIYQFHGVPVALAELDLDQIGIDLRSALAELESSRPSTPLPSENLFLALDKNVSAFPWESIPILRGRPVSRIPSLPFLLHQHSLQSFLSSHRPDARAPLSADTRVHIDSTKVFYILNPSGDLSRTQTHFEPWLTALSSKAGWKGIKGRAPTEMELEAALKGYDLVLYFGHGGAEQYIRSHTVCRLARCATTMLWGCSSGSLTDQGDFDVRGTAWNYMSAGCPSLVATLWDVTDKDIDRLSESVFNKLHLEQTHVRSVSQGPKMDPLLPLSELSLVEAVAKSRDECKLTYLTGAAPVVYGMPVWIK